MPNQKQPVRAPGRRETQSAESDVAAIFERRLLARGIRPDDFLDWRGSADIPAIPTITTIHFGRGTEESGIPPLAVIENPPPAQAVDSPIDSDEPDPDTESGTE